MFLACRKDGAETIVTCVEEDLCVGLLSYVELLDRFAM